MRVLVCGGRAFDDWDLLKRTLYYLDGGPVTCIIQGNAKGADELARKYAEQTDTPLMMYPPDWQKHGRAAGPIRNQRMIDEGKPDLVLAFPGGRGTADMVRRAQDAGIFVKIIEVN